MNRTSLQYGWKPDLPDYRDFKYTASEETLTGLPASVDMRINFPPVYQQGNLGSCTANAIAAAYQFEMIKQRIPDFIPSRLFIYYNERVIENSINSDSGASNRDGLNTVSQQGVCPEYLWPYNISEFTQKPYESCYSVALTNRVISYYSVNQDINQLKGCLADGYPFVFGFTVYSNFTSHEVAQTGIINLPGDDESMIGGHSVLAVGYDDAQNQFIVRNSWGANWGLNGYFMMPYEYLLGVNLSRDFWTIRLVENPPAA